MEAEMTRRFQLICLLSAFLFSSFAQADDFSASAVTGGKYRSRYKLKNASEKLIDNEGNGYDRLYGLRNMRSVLNGVYYRGGANNYFNKHKKRANTNPLPKEGLVNLCKAGFTRAVYFYDKNYETARKVTKCRLSDRTENTLEYLQISPLNYVKEDLDRLHAYFFDHVRHPRLGPIYGHCWNGWHASGYVAATTLRQFCDYSAEQAVAYWDVNTDGINTEPGYENIRQAVRDFTPNPNMRLTAEEKKILCPAPGDFAFR